MMSLPVWLPGPMFLPRESLCLVLCSFWGVSVQGVSVKGGLCPRGTSVQGLSVWGSLSMGSLSRGSLSRSLCPGGLCPGGLCQGTPLYIEERAVLILLECFRVISCLFFCYYESCCNCSTASISVL